MEYFSAPKKKDLSSLEKNWKSFKCILLGGKNQNERTTYCMIPTMTFQKRQNYGDIKNQWCPGTGVTGRHEKAEQ